MQRDVVRLPDGREGVREYIRHPGAVLALGLYPHPLMALCYSAIRNL